MIVCRAPYRISFFGGGTDYPVWYQKRGGAVLSAAIDKYCYITCRRRILPPNHHRIVYAQVETPTTIEEIRHPIIREMFRALNISFWTEIHSDSDLPARTGIGSSSTFTVALLCALLAVANKRRPKLHAIARFAAHIERDCAGTAVGDQDHLAATFGGCNVYTIAPSGDVQVNPIYVQPSLEVLERHLLLVDTGITRRTACYASSVVASIPSKERELELMMEMVPEAAACLVMGEIERFARLLHESWRLKRSLTSVTTTPEIDALYSTARRFGAWGGKLLGAGGGGFFLLIAPPETHANILQALGYPPTVPCTLGAKGVSVFRLASHTISYRGAYA